MQTNKNKAIHRKLQHYQNDIKEKVINACSDPKWQWK